MENPKRWFWAALICFVGAIGSLVLTERRLNADDELYRQLKPLTETLSYIQNQYVDEDKTKSKELVEGAIKGIMQTLDPYSQYMNKQEADDMKQDTVGAFGGLGIEISLRNKVLTVVSPIEDTPADKAGLKSGDNIVKINNESTDGLDLMDAVHKLRGVPGTKVTIQVYREGWTEAKDFTLTRAIIKIRSVRSSMLDGGKIGYIRLTTFMGNSAEDFDKALLSVKAKGAKSLVIDVRNNPGGLLNAAAEICSNFVPVGKRIVSTEGRFKAKNISFDSEGGIGFDGPIAVLVNAGSASASEILAGALQDHNLGVVVGVKTYGKGSVQTIFPLSDGGGLRLTTAKYMTPKGRALHGQGLEPDIEAEEEPYARGTLKMIEEGSFEGFIKDYLVENPGFSFESVTPKAEVKVSDSNWQHLKPENRENKVLKDFLSWMGRKNKKVEEDDLLKDRSKVLGKLKEELARKLKGEDAAREVALANDSQVKRALDVLKVASLVGSRKTK